MTIAMTTIIVSIISYSSSQAAYVSRFEQSQGARYALEGAAITQKYQLFNGLLTVPNNTAFSIGRFNVSTTVADNSSNIANTLSLTLTTTDRGRTYSTSTVIGDLSFPHDPTWWYNALAVNSNVAFAGHVSTHTAGDTVYANPNFSVGSASTINNVNTVGPSAPANVTITGSFVGNTTAKPWIRPNRVLYYASANSVLNGVQSFLGSTQFLSAYRIVCSNGDFHLGGTLSGTGVIYCAGDFYIDASTQYSNSATDKWVLVTPNTIHFKATNGHYVGYFYAGTVAVEQNTTIDSGAIVAKTVATSPGMSLDLNLDPSIKNNPLLGTTLHMPGCWP